MNARQLIDEMTNEGNSNTVASMDDKIDSMLSDIQGVTGFKGYKPGEFKKWLGGEKDPGLLKVITKVDKLLASGTAKMQEGGKDLEKASDLILRELGG